MPWVTIIGSHVVHVVSVQDVHFESKLSQFTIINPHVVQYAIKFVMDYNKRSNNNRKKPNGQSRDTGYNGWFYGA